ncbi:MAG: hypothetical protein RLZZ303_2283 [Candidatus Hydrogenedentota bacterium]
MTLGRGQRLVLSRRVCAASALVAGITSLCLSPAPARGAEDISRKSFFSSDYRTDPRDVRKYGDYFRDQFLVHATENDGWVDVEVTKIDRAPGGPKVNTRDPSLEELVGEAWQRGESGAPDEKRGEIRQYTKRVLCRLRSDVVIPAPANFLKNPGGQYRIMVQGVEVAPDYNRVFVVNAGEALDRVEAEFWEIYRRAHGMDREAIYHGMIMTMRSLNEAQRLPARIPVSLLRSEIGRYSIQQPFLDKPKPLRLERFGTMASGQQLNALFATDLSSRPSDGKTRELKFGDQKKLFDSRVSILNRTNKIPPAAFRDEVFQQKSAGDYREQLFMEYNDPRRKEEALGQPVRSIAGQAPRATTAYEASLETYELLTGEQPKSAIAARAGRD